MIIISKFLNLNQVLRDDNEIVNIPATNSKIERHDDLRDTILWVRASINPILIGMIVPNRNYATIFRR